MENLAVITGASQGLGQALAVGFWEAGYSLLLIARDAVRLDAVRASLTPRGAQRCHVLQCDLSDRSQLQDLSATLAASSPAPTVLINNAAMHGPIGPLVENDGDAWRSSFDLNLFAPVALAQALIPVMTHAGSGVIINLSGGGATGPRPNFSAYGAAKTALVRLSETLAGELKGTGIRVNCISPGPMSTSLLAEILDQGAAKAGDREHAAAKRVFESGATSMDPVVRLALFLASDAASGISGRIISAQWDEWSQWPDHAAELVDSDLYTLRRITGRERGINWGDK